MIRVLGNSSKKKSPAYERMIRSCQVGV